MTSSQHGSYVLGYTHATMAFTVRSHPARGSKPPKEASVQIALCNPSA